MKEHVIKFTSTEDIRQFVKAAGECDFEIDLVYQHIHIDAKSLLGVLGLGLAKELQVKCFGSQCDSNCNFEKALQRYAIV
ncbi:MAG: HPr family phosphocarrier protein [Lachnospiraceae bacterium]